MGNKDTAEKLIQKSLSFEDCTAFDYMGAGNLYAKMGDLDSAESYNLKAFDMSDDQSFEPVLENLVNFYLRINDLATAINYQKVLAKVSVGNHPQEKLALLYMEIGDKKNYRKSLDSLSDENLLAFFRIFYPDENIDRQEDGRAYIIQRLNDIYDSRILYKNIKY
jgi:tetratricopeptide (TPR) repeat protein